MAISNGDPDLRALLWLCGVEREAFRAEVQEKFHEIKNKAVRIAIAAMVNGLYDHDIFSIKRDTVRIRLYFLTRRILSREFSKVYPEG